MNYWRPYEHAKTDDSKQQFVAELIGGPRDGERVFVNESFVNGRRECYPTMFLSGHGFYLLDANAAKYNFNGGSKQ